MRFQTQVQFGPDLPYHRCWANAEVHKYVYRKISKVLQAVDRHCDCCVLFCRQLWHITTIYHKISSYSQLLSCNSLRMLQSDPIDLHCGCLRLSLWAFQDRTSNSSIISVLECRNVCPSSAISCLSNSLCAGEKFCSLEGTVGLTPSCPQKPSLASLALRPCTARCLLSVSRHLEPCRCLPY